MAALMEGSITIHVDGRDIVLDFREHQSRNAVLELTLGHHRLSSEHLRRIADELDNKEKNLIFMRQKYADMAGTALMFADEEYPAPASAVEEPDPDMYEELPEKGELLDSYESNTGNPGSGDSITELYEYQGRFWILEPTHGICRDFDTYHKAYSYGGFEYRDEHPELFYPGCEEPE